jgi:hypothetical protein
MLAVFLAAKISLTKFQDKRRATRGKPAGHRG